MHLTFVGYSWNNQGIFLYSVLSEHYSYIQYSPEFHGELFTNILGIYHANVPRIFNKHIFPQRVAKGTFDDHLFRKGCLTPSRLNKSISYYKIQGEEKKEQTFTPGGNHSYWKNFHCKKQKILFCKPVSKFKKSSILNICNGGK